MHDCPVAVGDAWLKSFTKPLLKSRQLARSVVFVVFDEGPPAAAAGSPLPAIVLGPVVRPGSSFNRVTSHYGLLRTIEDAWGLPSLGRSRNVSPITGIWR
jgi:acid phosphatase